MRATKKSRKKPSKHSGDPRTKDRLIPHPRVTLSPPLWTAGSSGHRYRIRPYADLPASFQYVENQGDMSLGRAHASLSIKEAFEVRFEPVSLTRRQMRWYCLLSYGGKRPIDYQAQCNHYINSHSLNYVASDFGLLRYGLGFLHDALVRAIKVSHTASPKSSISSQPSHSCFSYSIKTWKPRVCSRSALLSDLIGRK